MLIALFLWDVRWKGRAIILALLLCSVVLPLLGDQDSVYLYSALGFALRVAIACVYLVRRQLPVVS